MTRTAFRFLLLLFPLLWLWPLLGRAQESPDQQYAELFEAVQLEAVFPDSKTFPDCLPRQEPAAILRQYRAEKQNPGFDLRDFVLRHFRLPPNPASGFRSDPSRSVEAHINALWPVLTRQPDSTGGSLLALPHPYVVPGGRFREIYYWDSYFTLLGLQVAGRPDLIRHMVDNFAFLIDSIGFIPNGNRTYYTSRSQPPFYSLMVGVLREVEGDTAWLRYLPQLEQEHRFWMEGAASLTAAQPTHRRVVRLPGGEVLNRYWDDRPVPRPESYREDVALARESGREPETLYRHIRAAAESGWDFSSRWFGDGQNLHTIHTTDLIPVDLNALLYHLERTLAEGYGLRGESQKQAQYQALARDRQRAIRTYCWDRSARFYKDYDFVKGEPTPVLSLAGMYPLFFGLASAREARQVHRRVRRQFLQPGGLVTTLVTTHEQWDAPNGWAPLQWIGIQGLRHYRYSRTAEEIAQNWIETNRRVYRSTGKMMEKYNVQDLSLKAGGGEYPLQDGFGWSNGVLLRLLSERE